MEEEKKKMLFFGIILALIVVFSALYFIWGNFINKGKIKIFGEAPFEVEIYNGQKVQCDVSPCIIKEKSGMKDLIINKTGYKPLLKQIDVKIFKETELKVNFEHEPFLEETEDMPVDSNIVDYEIIQDEKNGMQKLIRKNDPTGKAIVYFQKKLKTPLIFGSEKSVLVVDSSKSLAYKIDVQASEKTSLNSNEFGNIEKGIWSDNGKYFVFEKDTSDFLWILNEEGNFKQSLLIKNRTSYNFGNEKLFFATDQKIETNLTGDINLLNEKSSLGVNFGKYDIENDRYYDLLSSNEIAKIPDVFIPLSSETLIYFKEGDKNFRIILK